MSPGVMDILRKRTRSEGEQGDAILKSSGISRRKSGSEGISSPSANGVMMARALYRTEKNFSSGSFSASGAAAAEGEAFGAAASSGGSGVDSVSGFLLKNSIFLFNAAKKRYGTEHRVPAAPEMWPDLSYHGGTDDWR